MIRLCVQAVAVVGISASQPEVHSSGRRRRVTRPTLRRPSSRLTAAAIVITFTEVILQKVISPLSGLHQACRCVVVVVMRTAASRRHIGAVRFRGCDLHPGRRRTAGGLGLRCTRPDRDKSDHLLPRAVDLHTFIADPGQAFLQRIRIQLKKLCKNITLCRVFCS